MKKEIFSMLMVSLLAISAAGCASTDDVTPSTNDEALPPAISETSSVNETTIVADNITADRAKEIALAHAGLTEADVTFVKANLDTDDGRQEYEIEFYNASTEYDYEIDMSTGEVLSYDSDAENYSASGSTQSGNTNTYIGEEKAKSIALAKVPGATESDIQLHFDSEDRMAIYEGSIVFGNMKYEFEINAATGTIVDWSVESVVDD
ncbi:PepSY domain-containing protein [Methanosarcina sp. UBA289]|uniref:PepSY domain-containing protein n=1 Tax=Methanosarcina sp. UBA289 TaxID=1915574 RepID=UPI0025E9FDBA|nr:PepSY domain-containing protein [Methanosarcina sp. UBA289]